LKPKKKIEKEDDEENKIIKKEIIQGEMMQIERDELIANEKKIPWMDIAFLVIILAIVSVHSLLVGGKGKSIINIQRCTWGYWALFLTIFPILLIFTYFIVLRILKSEKKKIENAYDYPEGDIRWNVRITVIVSSISAFAGIVSSLLGIGGGMIFSPLMLEFGILPNVAAATSSFMILFTSVSSCILYIVLGRIPLGYGVFYSILGFVSSFVGQTGLDYLVNKYNRKSYIVFSVVIIITIATILLSIAGTYNLVRKIEKGQSLGFTDYCTHI